LIQNSENRGFTGGNNQAISFLLAQGAEYIWVLNNDTVVDRNCLAELLRAAISSCPGAAFSAKIYYDMPPDRLWYAGAVRHRWHRAPIHLVNREPLANTSENIKEVEFLSGCCIFASVEVWRKNGGFIQEYIAYSEDSDWCWRMQEAGLKSYYVPAALLWHKLSASVRKNTSQGSSTTITPAAMYLMVRNHLWTVRRHERVWWKRYFHICVNLGIQIRNVVRFSLTREVPLAFQVIRAAKDGLFFGVPGEYPLWKEPNE
jgi:GT2 family glycosyltransferase